MARRSGSARRYADALFGIAVDRGSVDTISAELERLAAAAADPLTMRVLAGPGLTLQRKRNVVETLAGPLSQETRSVVSILLERHRAGLFPALARAFADRARERRGIELAEVTTAVDLPDEDGQAVGTWLAGFLGKQLEIRTRIDPEIIGGVVARIGDQLIDASVRGRLETLKRRLQAGPEPRRSTRR